MERPALGDGDDTHVLLQRTRGGDRLALDELFARHRPRLLRMAQVRLDPRLRGRVDAGDVVQETHVEAFRRLPAYMAEASPMPFFLWLRFLTAQQMLQLQRRHLGAQRRDVRQEVSPVRPRVPGASSAMIVHEFLAAHTGPSQAAIKAEERARLHAVLDALDPVDREVLSLRYFEQLTNAEVAAELGLATSAASKRHVRALRRLIEALPDLPGASEA